MERREESLALVDWRKIDSPEAQDDWYAAVRLFGRPQVFDRSFYPLYRRFLCACCRELTPWLTEASQQALDVIESFAYGRATFSEFVTARNAAKIAARRVAHADGRRTRKHAAAESVRDSARNDGFEALLLGCRAARRAGLTLRHMARIFERVACDWVAEGTRSVEPAAPLDGPA